MDQNRLRVIKGIVGLLGVAGVVPLLAGLVSNFSQSQWGIINLIPVVAGGGLVIAGLGVNLPAIVRGILTKKALIGTNVIFMVVLATAILFFVSYLNARHYRRFDATQLRRYTLTDKTKSILKNLDEPVRITTLFTEARPVPLYEEITDILDEYQYYSDKIAVEHIDSYFEQAKVQALATRLNTDATGLTVDSVVFEAGDRRKDVMFADMVKQPPPPSPYQYQYNPEPPQLIAESAFTEAILSVAEPRQTLIYFLTGHGERSVLDHEDGGLSDLVKALKRENYRVEELNLFAEKKIPEDCELLVSPSTAAPISGDLVVEILEYLSNGGRLLVMFEPLSSRVRKSGLESILSTYGLKVRNDVQVVNFMGMAMGAKLLSYELIIDTYALHKITEGLERRASLLTTAGMVDALPGAGEMGYKATVLFRSPSSAWGESDYGGQTSSLNYDRDVDEKGPVALAVAVEPKKSAEGAGAEQENTGAKIVAFGDVDFATNKFLYNVPGNLDLVLNAVNWLAGKEAHLGIGPREPEQRVANLTDRNKRLIYWITVAGLPGLCIFLGAFVWLVRRL